MGKRKRSTRVVGDEENVNDNIDVVNDKEEIKKSKWINKQRVLIFSSRGITFRERHLMVNLRTLLPHSKSESKMEKKESLLDINEICEMKNCNNCIFFENKKRKDLYMCTTGAKLCSPIIRMGKIKAILRAATQISNIPNGPSAKFLVENIHTMEELKLTGNCLKGSRPILSFDDSFEKYPHYSLLKELLVKIFNTPRSHPKSQPFIDHVFNFTMLDDRIWFRNYQIEDGGSLIEIGPRFVLNLIKIFDGSFGGQVLFTNSKYIPPSLHRRNLRAEAANRYKQKKAAQASLEHRRPKESYHLDPLDEIFRTIPPEEAKGKEKATFQRRKE